MTKSLESQFHDAMKDIYRKTKIECNYNASQFLSMISNDGGLKTAKKLLQTKEIQYGFTELWECGRLDLTVEAHVLKPEFEALFTEEEINEARNRLESHGYFKDMQGETPSAEDYIGESLKSNIHKYQVIYMENPDKPVDESKVEGTLNDMADRGWLFKQLSPGVNTGSGISKYWAYIVFEREDFS